MYLRFVYEKKIDGTRSRSGIFTAAYHLVEQPDTDGGTLDQVNALLAWFRSNLDVPKRFNRSRSKGYYRKNTKGLSWFKPSATIHLAKAFELCNLLRTQGYQIEIIKTARVGFVLYEDDFQLLAEPFADTDI